MDGQRFDDLTKALLAMPRRRALRLLAASLVGGSLVARGGPEALAHHKAGHRECKRKKGCASPEDLCCDGVCTNVTFNREHCGDCDTTCPVGSDCCGSRCVQLGTTENCSGCFAGCLPEEQCVEGRCIAA